MREFENSIKHPKSVKKSGKESEIQIKNPVRKSGTMLRIDN